MTEETSRQAPVDGELLPPSEPEDARQGLEGALNQTLIAMVSSYTDRPDLLIAEIEKHDPGFVRRMNQASELHAEEQRTARFRFGKTQAYTGLCVSVVAAVVVLGGFVLAISKEASLGMLLGIVAMYAVTQGGPGGFARMIEMVAGYFAKDKQDDAKTDSK